MGCLYALTCTSHCLGCSSYKAEEYSGQSEDLFDQKMENYYRKEEEDYYKKLKVIIIIAKIKKNKLENKIV